MGWWEMLEDNIGMWRRGGGGTGAKGRQARSGWEGRGSESRKRWSERWGRVECFTRSLLRPVERQDEGVCCWCCCSDSHRPAGELMCDTVILTNTHTHSPECDPSPPWQGSQLLYPVSGPASQRSHCLHTAHAVWLWKRESLIL